MYSVVTTVYSNITVHIIIYIIMVNDYISNDVNKLI